MSRTTELISGLVFIVLAIIVWVHAQSFPAQRGGYPGPALFPQVISGFLVVAGLVLFIAALRSGVQQPADNVRQRINLGGSARLLIGILLASLYPMLHEWLGFIPTVGILSFGVTVLLQAPLLSATLTSIGGTVLIYWIFTQLLRVPL